MRNAGGGAGRLLRDSCSTASPPGSGTPRHSDCVDRYVTVTQKSLFDSPNYETEASAG